MAQSNPHASLVAAPSRSRPETVIVVPLGRRRGHAGERSGRERAS